MPEYDDFLRTLQLRGWKVSEDDRDHEGARLSVANHIQEVLKDAMVRGLGEVVLKGVDGGVQCHALILAAVSPNIKQVLLDNLEDEGANKLVMVFTETRKAQLEDLVEMAHTGKVLSKDKNIAELLSSLGVNFTVETSNMHEIEGNVGVQLTYQNPKNCDKEQSSAVLEVNARENSGEKFSKLLIPEEMQHLLQCALCSEKVTSMSKLRKHVRFSHSDEEWNGFKLKFQTHQCPNCVQKFFTKVALRSHGRKVHGDYKTPLLPNGKHAQRKPTAGKEKRTCTACGKVCQSLGTLEEHLLTHTLGEQPFQCEDCGQRSSSRKGLKAHSALHGILVVPVLCNQCGKTLSTEWEVKKHKEKHLLEERHYSCRHCGKTFPDITACRKHQESSHRPEKRQLICSYCSHRCFIVSASSIV